MSDPLPWTPDHDLRTEQVRHALHAALPQSAIANVAFLAEGWSHRAYHADVDGAPWVFRFPKRAEAAASLAREVLVLDVLRSRVPAVVPAARAPWTTDSVPYPFGGYPRLPGTQLQHRPADWDRAERVGTELGRFLTALHDIPSFAYDGIDLPDYRAASTTATTSAKGLAALERVAATLAPALLRDVRRALATAVADPPVHRAVHCDLGDDHVLTDDDGRLTGVIDWEDFSLASPHSDFVGGTMALGDAFLLPALAAYALPIDADLPQRVRLSAVSVMVRCIDWGRHVDDPTWTAWNRARLPDRARELLARRNG